MKKSLIALAVLAAASAASAQSSVTLYGRLDLGASSVKSTTVTNANVSTVVKANDLFGAQSQNTTSRLGVKGVEDLGGGNKAFFNYEFKINPDSSDSSAVATTRLANVGVQGGFGAVVIGTYLNSIDTVRGYSASTFALPGGDFLARAADGSTTASVAAVAAAITATKNASTTTPVVLNGVTYTAPITQADFATGVSGRSQDSLAYRAEFAGVRVGLGVTSKKTTTTTGSVSGTTKQQGVMLGLGYGTGPISVDLALSSGKRSVSNAGVTTTDGKVADYGLGFSYDLGFAKPYIAIEQSKSTNNLANVTPGTIASQKNRAFEIGSTFAFGAFRPYVLVGQGKLTQTFSGTTVTATGKTTAWQVGSLYDLSKRTYLYASYGQDKIKDDTTAQNTKRNGFGMGVVHKF